MPLFGAHMSIAGGYYKAVDEAGSFGMEVVQIFTKNNNQWAGKPIVEEDVKQFRDALERHNVAHPVSHASYLINLAAPSDELWEKSIEAMIVELQRAETLGVKYVVVHPGAYTTTSAEEGIDRVAVAIDRIHDALGDDGFEAEILLENTAGQGSSLGHDFEHLSAMISKVRRPERVGVCFDTCHAFAAGHGFSEPGDLPALKRAIDAAFGLEKIRAVHLNDSKKGKGSRVDRHEHIGHGLIGLEGFRAFVNDPDFARIPMYMETPKEERDGEHWDAINLRTVRDLASGKSVLLKPIASTKEAAPNKVAAKKAAPTKTSKAVAKKVPASGGRQSPESVGRGQETSTERKSSKAPAMKAPPKATPPNKKATVAKKKPGK